MPLGNPKGGTKREQKATLPTAYLVEPQAMPGHVVYVPGGKLIPSLPLDPDLDSFVTAELSKAPRGKAPNGLPLRRDIFARLVARGATGAAAYRAAFNATDSAKSDTARASMILLDPRVIRAIDGYKREARERREQSALGMQDFVRGGLVKEAQTAPEASARIRAYELLGKTEAMFTDVKRTEKALDQSSLQSLKTQLEQRLRLALHRLAPQLVVERQDQDTGSDMPLSAPTADETADGGPHPGVPPLVAGGDPPEELIVTPSYPSVISSPSYPTPLDPQGSIGSHGVYVQYGEAHREMTEDDL